MTAIEPIELYRGVKPPRCTSGELEAYLAGELRGHEAASIRRRVEHCIALTLYECMVPEQQSQVDALVNELVIAIDMERRKRGNHLKSFTFGPQAAFRTLFAMARSRDVKFIIDHRVVEVQR